MANCKKYPTDKVLPDENNKCSLCGGDCTECKKITGYVATVQFNNEPEPISGYIFKIGSFDEETATEEEILADANVFYYLQNEHEMEQMKENGANDFVVLSYEPLYD